MLAVAVVACGNKSSPGTTTGVGGAASGGDTGAVGGDTGAAGAIAVGCPDPSPAPASVPPAACADSAPIAGSGPADVALTIDAAASLGAWNRFYEGAIAADHANTLLCTYWHRNIANSLKLAHDQAGFKYVRFHGILDDDIGVYSEDATGAAVYDWSRFDGVYDTIKNAGMRPIVEIGFMPTPMASDPTKYLTALWYAGHAPNISPPKDWDRWAQFMADIVTHLEARYGADEVRNNWYFEVWNEPSWMYSLGDNGYLTLYRSTVLGLRQGDPAIRVGGPAGSAGESPSMIDALIKSSKANNYPLDFVTYHRYGNDPGGTIANANAMQLFHQQIQTLVARDGFTGQVINDEFGPTWTPDITRDTEVDASFIVKTIHLLGSDPTTPPPTAFGYWTVSDLYEESGESSALAYQEGNFGLTMKGDPAIPASYDVGKPAFNAFRLLHMMGDTTVSVTGGVSATDGVNAAATLSSDSSAMQILVYNHVNGGTGDSTQSSVVTITVNNLPFGDVPVRVRQYLIDANHANSHTTWVGMNRPLQPTADQWTALRSAADLCYYETTATPTGGSLALTIRQPVYGVTMVELHR